MPDESMLFLLHLSPIVITASLDCLSLISESSQKYSIQLRLKMRICYGSLIRIILAKSFVVKSKISRSLRFNSRMSTSLITYCSINEIGLSAENSIFCNLRQENNDLFDHESPRQIYGSHFVLTQPADVICPEIVVVSRSCGALIGLNEESFSDHIFLNTFCGKSLLPGLDKPYSTNYGCHSYGTWFDQLGKFIFSQKIVFGKLFGNRRWKSHESW